MAELRYTAERRVPREPCWKCEGPFKKGDKVVARSRGHRGWEGTRTDVPTRRYHEQCWEKLFL